MMVRQSIVIGLLFASLFSSLAYAGDENSYIRMGAGYFGVNDDDESLELHLEYQDGFELFGLNPFVGVMANSDAAFYTYMGVRYDIEITDRLILAPQFGPGLYVQGHSKDLGHSLEFRSGVELSYALKNDSRLGATVYHLSNASLGSRNPGTEVFTLHYSQPLDHFFSDH